MKARSLAFCCAILLVLIHTNKASAYSYESVISEGCHEDLSIDALRTARQVSYLAAATAPTSSPVFDKDDQVLILDVPFSLPSDMQDIETVALLVGVRDNDLKGRHGIDSQELSTVHGDPEGQREHCLRRPEHDGPAGSVAALEECRNYIRDQVLHAINHGLGEDGRPDVNKRTVLDVHLAMAGRRSVALPLFYVYMGQALHTLQDSYTHTFRRPVENANGIARTEVTVVLNWVEFAEERLDERRDGPAHMVALDQCDANDSLRNSRRQEALLASQSLFAAALNPDLSTDERVAAVDQVLLTFMNHEGCGEGRTCEPSCTLTNRWCDAVENTLRPAPGCGCRIVGPAGGSGAALLLALLFALRIRRRQQNPPAAILAALLTVGLYTSPAQAHESDDESPYSEPETSKPAPSGAAAPAGLAPSLTQIRLPAAACAPGRQLSCACPGGSSNGVQRCLNDGSGFSACEHCAPLQSSPAADHEEPDAGEADADAEASPDEQGSLPPLHRAPFGAYATIGGAVDSLAISGSLAARYRLSDKWLVGVDVEWNPWCSLESKRCRSGSINFYASGIRRWSIGRDWVALRSTLHLGGSVLTFDLMGAPSGSIGPYIGASLLGVEFKLGRQWTLVLEPADVSLPAPHLTGAPLTYRQYRFTVGLQFGG